LDRAIAQLNSLYGVKESEPREPEPRKKLVDIGHTKALKSFRRNETTKKFLETCQSVSSTMGINRSEFEKASIMDYIAEVLMCNEKIRKSNEEIEKAQKK
jgi:hypothetical protein